MFSSKCFPKLQQKYVTSLVLAPATESSAGALEKDSIKVSAKLKFITGKTDKSHRLYYKDSL